ncbi:hypothetical protein IP70_16995 [alpha proteobacterium AAP38]|nr:hypothetical protein IP70_16995 [alpha proteobacterium AAP38]
MTFPRYPDYKDSGVDWLGEVPGHWASKPLWTLFHRTKRVDYADETLLSVYRDFGVIPKSSRDDNYNKQSEDLSLYQLVVSGDLVINKMKAWQGSVAVSGFRGIVSPAYFVYEALHQENSRYLHYLMRCSNYTEAYLALSKGIRINQWDLEPQYHSRLPVLLPPAAEQSAIAAFLDRETAKIDALVAEQERLIQLLKEKRQAVISHAVTKGLDPNVRMKDSGVEWLGEVPEHWTVAPVGARFSVQLGKMLDSSKITGEYLRPYLRVFDVQWGCINTDELPYMDFDENDRERFQLRNGDLLVNEGGSYVGRSAIWLGELDECYYQKALHRLRPRTQDDLSKFFYYVMFFATHLGVFVANGNQATIDHLTAEAFRRYRFAFPPASEQAAISDYLDHAVEGLDRLENDAVLGIQLLKEHRSALISAAVTGRIDVRGLVQVEDAA